MKNKDKQIKELKEMKNAFIVGTFVFLFLFVFSTVLLIYAGTDRDEYFQQLQSCQEKVPVWTLNVHCQYFEQSIYANITMIFDSYGEYKQALEGIELEGNCEVIK